MAERDDVYKQLLNEDTEFRSWTDEHRRHESRLAILANKLSLSPEEEVEEKTLKKRKLQLKDQISARLRGRELATH